MSSNAPRPRFTLRRLPSRSTTFAADVRSGLGATPKSLSPRWFYDALGSALFSAITNLPEYYVTRTAPRSSTRSAARRRSSSSAAATRARRGC